jgi:hypothetical protein
MRRPVALLLLALLLPAAYLGWRRADNPTQLTAAGWQERFLTCHRDPSDLQSLRAGVTSLCVLQVMKDAVDTDNLLEMQDGLALATTTNPALGNICHTPGHQAGQYAYAKTKDISALILGNRSAICFYAIGHGVLDGFAAAGPDDSEFRAAARACESIDMSGRSTESTSQVLGLCADGIGHAAWSSTKDPVAAALRCGFLTVEINQSACGEGVIMQIYEPAGSEASGDIYRASVELPSFCANWPGNAATRLGCYSGAGYIYSRPAWAFSHNRARSLTEAFTGDERRQLRTLVLSAVDNCRAHPAQEGVSRCLWSLAQQTPPAVYLDRPLLEEVCAQYGEWAEKCRTFRSAPD